MPNFQSFILQQVSRVFLSSEKYEELQKQIQRKSKAKALLREGNTHFEAKEYSAAISCAKSALKEMRYGKREKGSGAVTSFTAKDFDGRIVPALFLLAQSNMELRQFNHALFYCDQILAIRPHHHKTKFLQSNANLESGSFTKALSFYNTTHKKRKIQKF